MRGSLRRRMRKVCLLLLTMLALLGMSLSAEASPFGERVEGLTEITGVRVSSSQDKTRIVVDAKAPVTYRTMVLKDPGRVVVDIKGAWLSPQVKRELSVSSSFVSRARVAQFDPRTVRVVVETTVGKDNYKIFPLTGGPVPGRVVLDFGRVGPDSAGATIALRRNRRSRRRRRRSLRHRRRSQPRQSQPRRSRSRRNRRSSRRRRTQSRRRRKRLPIRRASSQRRKAARMLVSPPSQASLAIPSRSTRDTAAMTPAPSVRRV